MEILSSRIMIRPRDFERSLDFYARVLGLHVYREFGAGQTRGVVFFLGGGFLELSGRGQSPAGDDTMLWLQVRSLDDTHRSLAGANVAIDEPPACKPWGLQEMTVRDPDGRPIIFVEVPPDHPLRRDARG